MFVSETILDLYGHSREEGIARNCRFLQRLETELATVEKIRYAVGAR